MSPGGGGAAHISDVETGSAISLAGIAEVDALGETSVSPRVVGTSVPVENSFFTGRVSTPLGWFGQHHYGDLPIVDV